MVETKLKLVEPNVGGDFGLWFRAPVGPGGCSFKAPTEEISRYFKLTCDDGSGFEDKLISESSIVDGYYEIILIVIGDRAKGYVNDEEIGVLLNIEFISRYTGFWVGSGDLRAGTQVAVDYIKVWNLEGVDIDL